MLRDDTWVFSGRLARLANSGIMLETFEVMETYMWPI